MKKRFSIDPNTKQILKQAGIGFLVFSAVALVLVGTWYGTRLEKLTITTIEVQGGETINHDAVRKMVDLKLDGDYLNFIPRRFAWFYPHDDIEEVVGSVERLHNINVSRINNTSLSVTFDEYVPTALWCDSLEMNKCLFMSRDALAYTHAPKLTGGSLMRFVHLNEEPERNKYLIDSETFASLLRLTDLLAEYDWQVSVVELDSAGDAYMHLVGGGELKIHTGDTPEQIRENFLVILGSEEFSHLEPGNFLYVDLRFGNKVFVNENLTTPEEEVASSTEAAVEEE